MSLKRFFIRGVICAALAFFGLVFTAPTSSAAGADVSAVNSAIPATGAKMDWDNQGSARSLVDKLRGIATVILLIAIVTASLIAGITGKSTTAIFVAVGATVLYGGFWILLLIIQAVGAPLDKVPDPKNPVSLAANTLVVAGVIKDFVGYGVNMLTTVTMPFLIIYGFWMALGVASGESQGAGPQIKNYVVGATVALSASIIIQVFYRFG